MEHTQDAILIGLGKIEIERQTNQCIAHPLGYRQITFAPTKLLPHRRGVQRHVVENRVNSSFPELLEQGAASFRIAGADVEHMIVRVALCWHVRKLQTLAPGQVSKLFGVAIVNSSSSLGDFLMTLQLSEEISSKYIGAQRRTALVDPSILVHFTTEELGSISPFLPQNFRALNIGGVVDYERTTLAANEVLRFVEAVGSQNSHPPRQRPL